MLTPVVSHPIIHTPGMWDSQLPPSSMESFMRMTQPLRSAMLQRGRELRGVPASELEERLKQAQDMMQTKEIDCMLLTTEADVYYFTGLATRFWASPTRPLFLVVPAKGNRPIAVVPSCFPSFGKACWLGPDNVKTWAAPQVEDDGVTLLSGTLTEVSTQFKRVGFMMGLETHIRAPLADVDRIRGILTSNGIEITDACDIVKKLRNVKSPFEIERIRHVCDIASAAFAALPARLHAMHVEANNFGVTEREAQMAMRLLVHEFGADESPYVMTQSGSQGYDNIVLESEDHVLSPGDLLIIDTGIRFESYFCDFDRNFIVGGQQYLEPHARKAHEMLWSATQAAFDRATELNLSGVGCKASDLFHAQVKALDMNPEEYSTGRMGHGLGLQLTEIFSNIADDDTPIGPGVVFTIEPGMNVEGSDENMIVHEENVVIAPNGEAQWLSDRAPQRMVSILDNFDPGARDVFQTFEKKWMDRYHVHVQKQFLQFESPFGGHHVV